MGQSGLNGGASTQPVPAVLVTGANGFVGRALCATLLARGVDTLGAVRGAAAAGQIAVGDLDAATDWSNALAGRSVVVHLAARVHVMDDRAGDPLAAYRIVNVDATVNLARQAHAHGVRRFVFVSSIKVNGEATHGRPFRADDAPAPVDPYGQTKLEAERALQAFAAETDMELVIVRPPLVYGPGVKANFANLLRLAGRGIPLPLGLVRNRRSMVALDNLVDLLIVCICHRAAPGHVFLASDGVDLSTAELVTMMGRAMGKRVWLVPVPVGLMHFAAGLLGKRALMDRLAGSLQVDSTPARELLGWTPVLTPQQGIDRAAAPPGTSVFS